MSILKISLFIIISIILVIAVIVLGAFIYFTFFFVEPKYISDYSSVLDNVKIQPSQAIEIATPYIEEHATYSYKDDKELQLHIVLHKDWYYIMKTNYPAKTARYYMQSAVKIHINTGEVTFSKK